MIEVKYACKCLQDDFLSNRYLCATPNTSIFEHLRNISLVWLSDIEEYYFHFIDGESEAHSEATYPGPQKSVAEAGIESRSSES